MTSRLAVVDVAELESAIERAVAAALARPVAPPSDWLTTAEAAKLLGVSTKTLGRLRRERGLPAHGYRATGRARHALRATLVTLGTEDGAQRDVLDLLVWARPSEVRAGYQRFGWPALCAEVAKLRVELRPGADVVTLGRGSGGVEIPYSPPDIGPGSSGSVGKEHRGGGIRTHGQVGEIGGNRRKAAGVARQTVAGFRVGPPPPMHAPTQSPYSAAREAAELDHEGKPLSKTTQIALAGNSVPPVMAEAIVRANVAWEPGRPDDAERVYPGGNDDEREHQ